MKDFKYKYLTLKELNNEIIYQDKEFQDIMSEWYSNRDDEYLLNEKYTFVFIVCYFGNSFAGLVGVEINLFTDEDFYISPLFVSRYFRHLGIGTELMSIVKKIAELKKTNGITLYCDYKSLFSFYEKLGYVLDSYVEEKETYKMDLDLSNSNNIKDVNNEYIKFILDSEVVIKKDCMSHDNIIVHKGERYFIVNYNVSDVKGESFVVLSKSKLANIGIRLIFSDNFEEIIEKI